jgi:hypothetical protein
MLLAAKLNVASGYGRNSARNSKSPTRRAVTRPLPLARGQALEFRRGEMNQGFEIRLPKFQPQEDTKNCRAAGGVMPNATKLDLLANRLAAKRIAESEGRTWKEMSAVERSASKAAALSKVTQEDRKKALAKLARDTAKAEGKDWKTLPKEERQLILQKIKRPAAAKPAKKAKKAR